MATPACTCVALASPSLFLEWSVWRGGTPSPPKKHPKSSRRVASHPVVSVGLPRGASDEAVEAVPAKLRNGAQRSRAKWRGVAHRTAPHRFARRRRLVAQTPAHSGFEPRLPRAEPDPIPPRGFSVKRVTPGARLDVLFPSKGRQERRGRASLSGNRLKPPRRPRCGGAARSWSHWGGAWRGEASAGGEAGYAARPEPVSGRPFLLDAARRARAACLPGQAGAAAVEAARWHCATPLAASHCVVRLIKECAFGEIRGGFSTHQRERSAVREALQSAAMLF
ncbi:Protein of unknown function [Gryllus bimaculatus]|nr:Protein of unknown function [Gryllus bimaculatus]